MLFEAVEHPADTQVVAGLAGEGTVVILLRFPVEGDVLGWGQPEVLRVRPVISSTRPAVSYSRISRIRFLRDLLVCP